MCLLVSGKVKVRFQDEPEFIMGQQGMFRINPGRTCAVENRLYINAVLHISSMKSPSSSTSS